MFKTLFQMNSFYSIRHSILVLTACYIPCGCKRTSVVIQSNSMSPTIVPNQPVDIYSHLFWAESPKRDSIVAFTNLQSNGFTWTMRVVGIPNDVIIWTNTSFLITNSSGFSRQINTSFEGNSNFRVFEGCIGTISSGNYFVVGDNSTNAYDSRYWGLLSQSNILGLVKLK